MNNLTIAEQHAILKEMIDELTIERDQLLAQYNRAVVERLVWVETTKIDRDLTSRLSLAEAKVVEAKAKKKLDACNKKRDAFQNFHNGFDFALVNGL